MIESLLNSITYYRTQTKVSGRWAQTDKIEIKEDGEEIRSLAEEVTRVMRTIRKKGCMLWREADLETLVGW